MRLGLAIFVICAWPAFGAAAPSPIELQIYEIERRVKSFDFESGSSLSIENLYNESLSLKLKILRSLIFNPIAEITPHQLENYREQAKLFNRHIVLVTRRTGQFPSLSLLPLRSWKIAHVLLMHKLRQENFAKDDTDANEALQKVSLANIPIAYRLIEKRKAEGKFTVGPNFAPTLLASRQWREKRVTQTCVEILSVAPKVGEDD